MQNTRSFRRRDGGWYSRDIWMCHNQVNKVMHIPDSVNRMWIAMSETRPPQRNEDGNLYCFRIKPDPVDYAWADIVPHGGKLLGAMRIWLRKAYDAGYRYAWIEYEVD